MSLLAVLAAVWAVSLAYTLWIHVVAAAERARRRAGGPVRVAVRAWPPREGMGTWAGDARLAVRAILGIATDRPQGLPLAAAIIAAGGMTFVVGDLMMDEPALWPASAASSVAGLLPGMIKAVLLGLLVIALLGNCVWIFFAAPTTLSWERLVLHPGGRIELEGGPPMPAIDPDRATLIAMSIPSAHGAPAAGVTLEQDDRRFAFDFLGPPSPRNLLGAAPGVPADWWQIVLSGETGLFDDFLKTHYGPGAAPYRRFMQAPADDS